jgi:hypothetical protein
LHDHGLECARVVWDDGAGNGLKFMTSVLGLLKSLPPGRVSATDLEPVRNFSLEFCDFGRISLVAVFE